VDESLSGGRGVGCAIEEPSAAADPAVEGSETAAADPDIEGSETVAADPAVEGFESYGSGRDAGCGEWDGDVSLSGGQGSCDSDGVV
jgi:hypothetical protein